MKECRFQWNRAVKTRRRLKGSLQCFKVAPVIREIFSIQKFNNQPLRAKAIARISESFPDCDARDLPTLYDLNTIFGKAFPIKAEHVDLHCLSEELQPMLRKEMTDFRAYWRLPEKDRSKSPPKRTLYCRLLHAATNYSGMEAQRFMNAAFTSRGRSTVRFKVSGSINANFERACSPSPDQRKIGNLGEPRRKRRVNSFGYQKKNNAITGDQLRIPCLPKGMEWVRILWHRPLPEEAILKQITIMQDGRRWYAVLTCDIPEELYRLEPATPELAIGLDPGAVSALTAAVIDQNSGELKYEKYDWRPLEQNLDKLEKLSQRLSNMKGPDRRKGQKASKRWLKLNAQRTRLHSGIRNQRQDVLHKLSRHLADHGFIAIGHWEPPRKVAGRAAFREGNTETVEPGPKGIVAVRRGGRDRSIATLRMMTLEKAKRCGVQVIAHADEYNTTRSCSACSELTGPKGDTSIREWTCSHCGTEHDRDQNAALNILTLALAESDRDQGAALDGIQTGSK
jgi:transposase